MKGDWAASCSSDDQSSQWDFYSRVPVLLLPPHLRIQVLSRINMVNDVPECSLI